MGRSFSECTWRERALRGSSFFCCVPKGYVPELQLLLPSAAFPGVITCRAHGTFSLPLVLTAYRTCLLIAASSVSTFHQRAKRNVMKNLLESTLVSFYEPGKMNHKMRPSFQQFTKCSNGNQGFR